jgi:virginiamycin B lyase
MRARTLLFMGTASLTAAWFLAGPGSLVSQTPSPAALTGVVSSTEEGPMEGVMVSAKKAGGTITITVASDQNGRYSFPRNRLEAGSYTLRTRAVGYDLDDPGAVEVTPAKAAAEVNLKLHKAPNLASQITNAEWILSIPTADKQKGFMLNCVQCHTLERILRSKHDAAEFLKVMERMGSYANQSFQYHPQKRMAMRMLEVRGEELDKTRQRQADFLAAHNLSTGATWPYDFKTLPRPKGSGTKVIITEYDLPRRTIEPHDVMMDLDGNVWYSSFGEQSVGKMDPQTGKITEYNIPIQKQGWPTGELGLESDRDGNLWFGMTYQAAVAKFDRKTEKFQIYLPPAEYNKDMTQINMAAPQSSHVDGKFWSQNNGFAVIHRYDIATGQTETFAPFKNSKEGENHNIYDVIPDAQNNAYFTDFAQEHIGRLDAKTGKISLWPTPTKDSAPRRGQMDAEGRIWFGEYRGNRIGMFDTKTEKFQEWEAPTPWSAPYDATMDKTGHVWTGSMTTDRVIRLDPKSGKMDEYLLPRSTNIRRVFVDDRGAKPALWVGNNHGASIVKLEPLD